MEDPINESERNKTSEQQKPTQSKEEDDDYVLPCCNDDFVWPELSSSDDLSNPNIEQITICSVPTTPESPNVAVSAATDNVRNLGFSEEEFPSSENEFDDSGVFIVSSDDEKEEERENVEEFNGDLEMEKIERIRAKISTLRSQLEEESDVNAVECLIEVMKQMFKIDMKNNGKDVDILETVKSRGMTFPRPRGYAS